MSEFRNNKPGDFQGGTRQQRDGRLILDSLFSVATCIEIMKRPAADRQQTEAIDHLLKVEQVLMHLSVRDEVA